MTVTQRGAGNGSGQQSAYLEAVFYDAAAGGNPIGTTLVSNAATAPGTWTALTLEGLVPVGARSIELRALTRRPANYYANRAGFDDQYVRSQTGIGATAAAKH